MAKELEKFNEQAANFDALQAETTTLKRTNLALEEKLMLVSKESGIYDEVYSCKRVLFNALHFLLISIINYYYYFQKFYRILKRVHM